MEIILSNASSKPIYEQIALQIKEHIMKGELKANDPLPSMRKLAKDLHVSIIFIIEENRRRIEKLLSDACELAKQNGITVEELLQTLQLIFKEM